MNNSEVRNINRLALQILTEDEEPAAIPAPVMQPKMEDADVDSVIKSIIGLDWGGSNDEQGKAVELLKGLAFSDDHKANKFMATLNKFTSSLNPKEFEEGTWVGNPKGGGSSSLSMSRDRAVEKFMSESGYKKKAKKC